MSYQIQLTLLDQKAISIVSSLPEAERDRTLERYILLGDTVVRYASITTSSQSVKEFFDPHVQALQGLAESLREAKDQLATVLTAQVDAHTS